MSFDGLLTKSLLEQTASYLQSIDPFLLSPSEIAALNWAMKFKSDYGKLPSETVLHDHPDHGLCFNNYFKKENIEYAYDEAIKELRLRKATEMMNKFSEEADSTGAFPVEKSLAFMQRLNQATTKKPTSILTIDRDPIYQPIDLSSAAILDIPDIDADIGGVMPGEELLLVARPGAGKSFLSCYWATKFARAGKKVLMISAEMSHIQLTQRIDGFLASFNPFTFRKSGTKLYLNERRSLVMNELEVIKSLGGDIFMPKPGEMTIENVEAQADTVDPDIIIVDGIYLLKAASITGAAAAGWQVQKEVSNRLKRLAMQKNVPLIATSQLSRQSKDAVGADLDQIAYSDSLGQDADSVIFMSSGLAKYEFMLEVAKNRNGDKGTICEGTIDWETMTMSTRKHVIKPITLRGKSKKKSDEDHDSD